MPALHIYFCCAGALPTWHKVQNAEVIKKRIITRSHVDISSSLYILIQKAGTSIRLMRERIKRILVPAVLQASAFTKCTVNYFDLKTLRFSIIHTINCKQAFHYEFCHVTKSHFPFVKDRIYARLPFVFTYLRISR